MRRTVTIVAADNGAAADVRLEASLSLAEVLPRLTTLTGSTATTLFRDGAPLDPGLPVAHLRDGDVLCLGEAGSARPVSPARCARIEAIAGPDAAAECTLPPGHWDIGRDASALPLTDPRVSRRHLRLTVTDDCRVSVTDLGSANQTWLGTAQLRPGESTPWPAGVALKCGTTWLVHGRSFPRAAVTPGNDGAEIVSRPPRLDLPAHAPTITFPPPPTPVPVGRLPLLASLAPLLAGFVLAAVMRRWEFLAFAVMSPLVVLGQALTDRWGARRTDRHALRDHQAATASAEARLEAALADEQRQRHERAPDLAALTRAATDRTGLLWHRGGSDPDALLLRLGLGAQPCDVPIDGDRPRPALDAVPICVDVPATGVLGLCGDAALELARGLVVQAVTLLGPADLALTVLAPAGAPRWAWTRWLPHATIAATPAQVRQLAEAAAAATAGRLQLVVADGADTETLAMLAAAGTPVLVVAACAERLPAACSAVVEARPSDAVLRRSGFDDVQLAPDLLAAEVAERVARALCPLRDGKVAAGALPTDVSWSQLHAVDLGSRATSATLLRRWRSGPTTAVCLGMSADGPFVVDLAADGPHLLVAGTTGSGKSELLQSLVASLVAGNSPADLNLLLVDFKGGAAFGPCAQLPHTVGVVTDLDQVAASRAIESLTAELRRREHLLAIDGAPDIDAWRMRAHTRPDEQLPRLVIVVDEFAALAEELPDFVGGLVGIAQRGRSLGVHLVLATQRPEGAVSADIRANTRLRICLAVAREAESRDVIDSPRALDIKRTTPGRALVRCGAGELVEVQAARVAGPARSASDVPAPVELVPLVGWGAPAGRSEPRQPSSTELELLVAAAVEAADRAGMQSASPPWLPPLPDHVELSRLASSSDGIAVGVVDQPDLQRQPPLLVSRDDCEPWLVVGGGRSGRSTALVTFAAALAGAARPDDQHIYAITHGNALSVLTSLPHTGAVVDVREVDRVERLLTFLAAEVDRRTATPTDGHAGILLLVDGWDSLSAATADIDAGRCQDLLLRLLADGARAGLRVVMTSDRSGLTGRLSATVRHRLCLRLADPADYALLGLTPGRVPSSMPPGRAIRAEDGALLQLAVADEGTVRRARAWPAPERPARRFEPLPHHVPLHTLGPACGGLIVGVGGDEAAPVTVDLAETGGSFLVAGPPRSGRSTALVAIAAQLQGRTPVALCNRPGPLRQRRDLAVIADAGDAERARETLRSLPADGALLVDDVDLLDDPGLLDGIEAAMRRLRDGGGLVVLAGTTEAMAASFRGPVAQARRGRAGLLLRPDGAHDGEVLGLRLRRRPGHSDPPGRGVLALHGRALAVQVPDPS